MNFNFFELSKKMNLTAEEFHCWEKRQEVFDTVKYAPTIERAEREIQRLVDAEEVPLYKDGLIHLLKQVQLRA